MMKKEGLEKVDSFRSSPKQWRPQSGERSGPNSARGGRSDLVSIHTSSGGAVASFHISQGSTTSIHGSGLLSPQQQAHSSNPSSLNASTSSTTEHSPMRSPSGLAVASGTGAMTSTAMPTSGSDVTASSSDHHQQQRDRKEEEEEEQEFGENGGENERNRLSSSSRSTPNSAHLSRNDGGFGVGAGSGGGTAGGGGGRPSSGRGVGGGSIKRPRLTKENLPREVRPILSMASPYVYASDEVPPTAGGGGGGVSGSPSTNHNAGGNAGGSIASGVLKSPSSFQGSDVSAVRGEHDDHHHNNGREDQQEEDGAYCEIITQICVFVFHFCVLFGIALPIITSSFSTSFSGGSSGGLPVVPWVVFAVATAVTLAAWIAGMAYSHQDPALDDGAAQQRMADLLVAEFHDRQHSHHHHHHHYHQQQHRLHHHNSQHRGSFLTLSSISSSPHHIYHRQSHSGASTPLQASQHQLPSSAPPPPLRRSSLYLEGGGGSGLNSPTNNNTNPELNSSANGGGGGGNSGAVPVVVAKAASSRESGSGGGGAAAGDLALSLAASNSLKWCERCARIVHVDSRHCKRCGVCCYGFDHHCTWLSRCVGVRNQHVFASIVGAAFFSSFCGMMLSIFLINEFRSNRTKFDGRIVSAYGLESNQTTALLNNSGAAGSDAGMVARVSVMALVFLVIDALLTAFVAFLLFVLGAFHIGLAIVDARTLDFARWYFSVTGQKKEEAEATEEQGIPLAGENRGSIRLYRAMTDRGVGGGGGGSSSVASSIRLYDARSVSSRSVDSSSRSSSRAGSPFGSSRRRGSMIQHTPSAVAAAAGTTTTIGGDPGDDMFELVPQERSTDQLPPTSLQLSGVVGAGGGAAGGVVESKDPVFGSSQDLEGLEAAGEAGTISGGFRGAPASSSSAGLHYGGSSNADVQQQHQSSQSLSVPSLTTTPTSTPVAAAASANVASGSTGPISPLVITTNSGAPAAPQLSLSAAIQTPEALPHQIQ